MGQAFYRNIFFVDGKQLISYSFLYLDGEVLEEGMRPKMGNEGKSVDGKWRE